MSGQRPARDTTEPTCELCDQIAGFHTADGRDLCGDHWRADQVLRGKRQARPDGPPVRQGELFGGRR